MPEFDYDGARAAEYSDEQIRDYIDQQIAALLKAKGRTMLPYSYAPPGAEPPSVPQPPLPAELSGGASYGRNPRTGQPMYETGPGFLDEPTQGIPQMAGGFSDLFTAPTGDARAQALSDILRGGMQTASPLMIPAAVAAPAATLAGLAYGSVLGTGTEHAARQVGVSPGYSALAGDAMGLLGGGWAGSMAGGGFRPGRGALTDFLRGDEGEILINRSQGWGSTLRDLIEEKMPAKASAEQVRSILSGAPAEEVKYSNLSSMLEDNPVVTKKQVLGHLDDNALPLTEVLRTEGDTKYGRWKTEHGKDYQELLLTKGEQAQQKVVEHPRYPGEFYAIQNPDGSYQLNDHGVPQAFQSRYDAQKRINSGEEYRSGHWDEPNVLAHTRFQEHTDMQGNPVFLVDELQSDWHQAGRKQGYKAPEMSEQDKQLFNELLKQEDYLGFSTRAQAKAAIGENSDWTARWEVSPELAELGDKFRKSQSGVPEAPFSKDWHEVMFKRMLTEAVNRGHDTLAWPKGKNVAERFNLRQAVEEVKWNPNGDLLRGYGKDGQVVFEERVPEHKLGQYVGKDIADNLIGQTAGEPNTIATVRGEGLEVGGKGMEGFYDKIVADYANKVAKRYGSRVEERQLRGMPVASPTVQKIMRAGDLAMERYGKNYYDLPIELMEQLDAEAEALVRDHPEHLPGATVHAIKITPAMKDAVKRGLPLFGSKLPDGTATAAGPTLKNQPKKQ